MSNDPRDNLPRANAWEMTNAIMAAISQAFTNISGEALQSLPYDITDIITDELEKRDTRMAREIAGPPMIHVHPPRVEPPPPPPSRELLMKYIAHVSEMHGTKFLVSFQKSSVEFSRREMTEVYELEATYTTGQKL